MTIQYEPESIRYLGIKPGRLYVFSSAELLGQHPELQRYCFDYYDLEHVFREAGVILPEQSSATNSQCLYVYFGYHEEAVSFLLRLNQFLSKLNPEETVPQ